MSESPPGPGRARARQLGTWSLAALAGLALAYAYTQRPHAPEFIGDLPQTFANTLAAPPAADSAQTRGELDELLALQARRSPAEVEAARADRKTRIERFGGALGLTPEKMAQLVELHRIAERVEDEIRPFVRAAKDRFRRLRPYEIESRLKPCIDNVKGDLSYPSGHATYGYAMGMMLIEMVPERRQPLQLRADEFARQRMVCGVHFRSDIVAGRDGAQWLMSRILHAPDYRAAAEPARRELRAALGLAPEPVSQGETRPDP